MSGQSHGELLRLQKVEPFRSHAKSLCVRLTCTIKLIYQVKWINTSEKTTRNSLQHRIKSLNNWLVFVSMRGVSSCIRLAACWKSQKYQNSCHIRWKKANTFIAIYELGTPSGATTNSFLSRGLTPYLQASTSQHSCSHLTLWPKAIANCLFYSLCLGKEQSGGATVSNKC